MKNSNELYITALNAMTAEFTSNQFWHKVYDLGGVYSSNGADFLHKHASNTGGLRTWLKFMIQSQPIDQNKYDVDEAINFLKSKGFKVMAPVNEWREV